MSVPCTDGFRLQGELFCPVESPCTAVLLSHAMMVDRRTLDKPKGEGLLSALLAQNVAVLCVDLRGHGDSGPRAHEGGQWSYDDLVTDTGVLAQYLRRRFPERPLIGIGHSLFGHVLLAYQGLASKHKVEPRFDGLVALGSSIWMPKLDPYWWRVWLKYGVMGIARLLTMAVGRAPARFVGFGNHDESYVFFHQLGSWLYLNDWVSLTGESYWDSMTHIKVPILSVAGSGDLISSSENQSTFISHAEGELKHRLVGVKYGDDFDPGHMDLVLDGRMGPVWDEISEWVATTDTHNE